MENQEATTGIKEILAKFDNDDLVSLSSTITQGLLLKNQLKTREDAVEAIIKYSPDVISILRRKAVKRDILFSYLHEHNVHVVLPTTKSDLISKISSYWNLSPKSCEVIAQTTQQNDQSEGGKFSVNALALQFSEWFYSMLNENKCIGAEHFWQDSKLKLNLITGYDTLTQTVADDPDEITRLLFTTKSNYNLYFQPNLHPEGTQGRMDPHGPVLVLCCGTLHSNNKCSGVFEQVFTLATDPQSDNNWKIKTTELNLKSVENFNGLPQLCESDLTSSLLALPPN